ncbi:MAG: NIPSNAP family protein [Lautropia sp.]
MFHTLSIQTGKAGMLPALVHRFSEETLPLRRRHGGAFRGAWTSEFGDLNGLFVLWEFGSLAELHATAEAQAHSAEWIAHIRSVGELIDGEQVMLLKPYRPITRPADEGRMYDFRIYDIKPFHADEYARLLSEVMPVRERHSRNFGIWTPMAGNVHSVVHLWPYEDADQRLRVRAAVAAEPQWKEYVGMVFPLLVKQRSSLLRPVPGLPRV